IEGIIGIRSLRPQEIELAQTVYNNTVPLDRCLIVSMCGFQNRQFTLPGTMVMTLSGMVPGIGSLLLVGELVAQLQDKYLLFLGKRGYNDAINGRYHKKAGDILIHELAHVWQGVHYGFPWDYVFNSVWNQCRCSLHRKSAYSYVAGKQWNEYECEPQAQIVE